MTCRAEAYRRPDGWLRHAFRCTDCGIDTTVMGGREAAQRLATDHNAAAALTAAVKAARADLRCHCWEADSMEQAPYVCPRCLLDNALETVA